MCALFGFHSVCVTNLNVDRLVGKMRQVILAASKYGKDAAGFVLFVNGKAYSSYRTVQPVYPKVVAAELMCQLREALEGAETGAMTCTLIGNFRGEPTSEWCEKIDTLHVQPYLNHNQNSSWYVVHNGTIANDKDLAQRMGMAPVMIDSEILPYVLGSDTVSIDDVVGSVAMAAYTPTGSGDVAGGTLLLAKNYRPLHAAWFSAFRGYIYTSYLEDLIAVRDHSRTPYELVEFPPNSIIELSPTSSHPRTYRDSAFFDPVRRARNTSKVAVVLSGGLDSTTVAALACRDADVDEVHLLHFHYGCRAQNQETKAAKNIMAALRDQWPDLKIGLRLIDLDFLRQLGGNALTDHELEVKEGEEGVEFAHEWVPYRNGVMVSLAAAYCDRFGIGTIMMGTNLEEAGSYPDNGKEFYDTLSAAMQIGSKVCPVIKNPLECMMKHEIVAEALEIHAPIHLSWSCYHGGDKHCGKCGPCYNRRRAFAMNHTKDMLEYEYEE